MTEELQTLWQLRGLDERLAAVQATLRQYPEQRKVLGDRLATQRARGEDFRKHTGDFQLQRRQLEKDIETLGTEEKKFQSQLPLVKKNEEYTALLHEIAGVKGRRSDRETELLLLMEEEDKLQREKPLLDRELAATETETAERLKRIAAEEEAERTQLESLMAEHRALAERLPAGTRSRYERIRNSRDGRAVVAIMKGACGGCYRGQPPQVIQEAKRGDRLLTCDGCGRLLVWPPDAGVV